MKFIHHNLGHCSGGQTVEVTLSGNAANVQLMGSSNFSTYKAGCRYRPVGSEDCDLILLTSILITA